MMKFRATLRRLCWVSVGRVLKEGGKARIRKDTCKEENFVGTELCCQLTFTKEAQNYFCLAGYQQNK
jgi:hypothetical protein